MKARSSPDKAASSRDWSWGSWWERSCGRGAMYRMKRERKGEKGRREKGNRALERRTKARLSIRKHDAFTCTRVKKRGITYPDSNSYLPGSASRSFHSRETTFPWAELYLFIFFYLFFLFLLSLKPALQQTREWGQ